MLESSLRNTKNYYKDYTVLIILFLELICFSYTLKAVIQNDMQDQ